MKYLQVTYSRKNVVDYREFATYEELEEWKQRNAEIGILIEIVSIKEAEL